MSQGIAIVIGSVVVVTIMITIIIAVFRICCKRGESRSKDTVVADSRFRTLPMDTFKIDMENDAVVADSRFRTLTMDTFKIDMENDAVVADSRSLTLTMDKFLSDMEKEKPIRFSAHQLTIATDGFIHIIGSGGFGTVYKGLFNNGTLVAVKVLTGTSDKRIEEQFMAEVSTIGRTHHVNLVRLYGFCFDRNLQALVYEYMVNGSLDSFLFQEKKAIEFEKLHEIAVGTAKGIAYLHHECQQRIIHYDIKPGNILLDSSLTPKVADFGLAKLYNRDNSHATMTAGKGTPGYAAPEMWQPYPVTCKCDVFSFGMLLFEIIGRRRNLDINVPETESEGWLPKCVWNKFEKEETGELMVMCGLEEKDRELAERMVKVALWCVQYLPQSRPWMSLVVKMLEGGMDIPKPPNPFKHMVAETHLHLFDSGTWTESWLVSASSQVITGSPSVDATPIMRKYEIEMASI